MEKKKKQSKGDEVRVFKTCNNKFRAGLTAEKH